MTTKLLFSTSLEKHMDAYMQEVKMNEVNEQYQLAQANIVRQGERMLLSQADIMNKLEHLKAELKKEMEVKTSIQFPNEPSRELVQVNEPVLKEKRPSPVQTKKSVFKGKRPIPDLLKISVLERKRPPPVQTKISPISSTTSSAFGSPTESEATTIASTMATSANPSSPQEVLKNTTVLEQRKAIKDLIASKVRDGKMNSRSAKENYAFESKIKGPGSLKELNALYSQILSNPRYL